MKNPLRCSLLCGTWQSLDGDLPDTKAKLYQRFVTTLYQWKKPRLNWIQQQELNAALGKLALSGMLNETSRLQLPESVGYRVMGEFHFELASRLGWLNLVARDAETAEGIYAFYHPTFQEYFAALAIEDWHFFLNHITKNPQHPDARYRIFEKQWKEVILLWLGREEVGKEEKEGFIEALVKFKDGCNDFYRYRAYFLAAAGIVEFKDCSLADEIVSQIIKWGFGYFNEKNQQWQTFTVPFAEGSREILKETDRERAMSALVELIATSQNEDTGWRAAYCLGEIDKDNPVAIATLVELIRNSSNKSTRRRAASSLGRIDKNNPVAFQTLVELIRTSQKEVTGHQATYNLIQIGKDNPVAIEALVELIRTFTNESTQMRAAFILGRIDNANPVAIAALVELIRTSQDENSRIEAAFFLEIIGKDNPVAIEALVELIRTSQDKNTRSKAAQSLGEVDKNHPVAIETLFELIVTSQNEVTQRLAAERLVNIGKDNPVAIEALVELIRTERDENTIIEAAYVLGKIDKNNPVAIEALVELIRTAHKEVTRRYAADSLGEIDNANPVAIQALVELIRTERDENTRSMTALRLGKIDKNNPIAIQALVELIRTSQYEYTRKQAADSLGEIDKDNPVVISALVELIRTSQKEVTRRQAADSLLKIDKDNPVAIAALVELISNSGDEVTRRHAAYKLGKIGKDNPVAIAVSGLKDCLNSEIYENDFIRYEICYKVIWDCAQNMTYPEFYQAWHTQPTNSLIPDRNPQNTDIPTLLKQLQPTDKTFPVPLNIRALEGETDTRAIAQEICTQLYQAIFPADADIPAIRNAPEFKRLIPQLKNRLQKQHIALILHSCPCEDALSSFCRKLTDSQMGIHIAWITDAPLELPLTGFGPNQEDLLNAVQNWIGARG
ncbi:HEAT repeat domain-containing protein [Microcoleus sp. AT3-A2]|uniref:HEAT repeat domain-containing protein n=1 Tax=Microcoleus sp. AT3-A2 TaxID=2818610 RepID=UPI002FD27C1F